MRRMPSRIAREERGQAAVTDALYFLMVVTFLSIFMFGFASTYGNSVKDKISDEYSTTFATNALKTILYASTPRDAGRSVYDKGAEIDYLLAIIKEDYSDDTSIGPAERRVLGKTITSVMAPIADTKDYVFYITIPKQEQTNKNGQFVFLFFHTTNFEQDTSALQGKPVPPSYMIQRPGNPAHRDYFCAVLQKAGGAADYDSLAKRLSRLFANVGPVSQGSAQVKLVQENPTDRGAWFDFKAQADLAVWDAAWLGKTRDRDVGLLYGGENSETEINPDWECVDALAPPPSPPAAAPPIAP